MIIASAALVFVICGVLYWQACGEFKNVQVAKYPPRIYYLSYGILMVFLLLRFCETVDLKIYTNKLVRFTSKNSMWLYLWHVLALRGYDVIGFPQIWYVKFVVVYGLSALAVVVVNKLLDIVEKYKTYSIFRYLRY